MKTLIIMEDSFGPPFIKKMVKKKQDEGMFENVTVCATHVSLSKKISRVIKINAGRFDRILIMADADGREINAQRAYVEQFTDSCHADLTRIIIFTHEIEDWICYSMNINLGGEKPSLVLKHRLKYQKKFLPRFASEIDCSNLDRCASFQEFRTALM